MNICRKTLYYSEHKCERYNTQAQAKFTHYFYTQTQEAAFKKFLCISCYAFFLRMLLTNFFTGNLFHHSPGGYHLNICYKQSLSPPTN